MQLVQKAQWKRKKERSKMIARVIIHFYFSSQLKEEMVHICH